MKVKLPDTKKEFINKKVRLRFWLETPGMFEIPQSALTDEKMFRLLVFCCLDVFSWILVKVLAVFVCLFAVLSPCLVAAASPRRCHTIYKGFAHCLMTLGDSLTNSAQKDEDGHEIHSICRWPSDAAVNRWLSNAESALCHCLSLLLSSANFQHINPIRFIYSIYI